VRYPVLPCVPLFPSERKCRDGSCSRATADVFRRSLAETAERQLPAWAGKLTPHVLRHSSQLYLARMSPFAIQELLGHAWTATTARQSGPAGAWTGTPPISSPPLSRAPPGNPHRLISSSSAWRPQPPVYGAQVLVTNGGRSQHRYVRLVEMVVMGRARQCPAGFEPATRCQKAHSGRRQMALNVAWRAV
jgi:hypothetical protein